VDGGREGVASFGDGSGAPPYRDGDPCTADAWVHGTASSNACDGCTACWYTIHGKTWSGAAYKVS
jgi:hypothetical protein